MDTFGLSYEISRISLQGKLPSWSCLMLGSDRGPTGFVDLRARVYERISAGAGAGMNETDEIHGKGTNGLKDEVVD